MRMQRSRTRQQRGDDGSRLEPRHWRPAGDKLLDIALGVAEQKSLSVREQDIISGVMQYFADRKHSFEGLASYVACRVIGAQCKRGWVTKRSGDGGVDFVCRLDLGQREEALSQAPVVVLGQAKCIAPQSAISGSDLARVVARLQRGWIGVFVTTGWYSHAAQMELAEDHYPIVLVNGALLARTIDVALTEERIELRTLLDRETTWYERHMQYLSPSRILDESVLAMYGDDCCEIPSSEPTL